MSQKSDLLIRIPSGSSEAQVTLTDDRGVEAHKTVVMDSLISNLTSSFKFSTGLLPNNTRFFSGTATDYIIGIESPSRVRRFLRSSYTTRSSGKLPNELKIPFPTCLFVFYVKGIKIRNTRVFSLRSPLSRSNDVMSRFPFGNTYQDGKVCWGSAKLPSISNPMMLVSCIATFYDAPFNGDLFDRQTFNRPLDTDIASDFWSLLAYLNGKGTFPQEMLRDLRVNLNNIMRDPNV